MGSTDIELRFVTTPISSTPSTGNDSVTVGSDLLAGDDTFEGTATGEEVYGGTGRDSINGNGGNDTLYGGDGSDSLSGGDGNDRLYGDSGNDRLDGGDGNDVLFGGDGNDTLDAGSGNDTVQGGDGNDELTIGSSVTASDQFLLGSGDDTIVLSTNNVTGSNRIQGGGGTDTLRLDGEGVDYNFSSGGSITQNVASEAITGIERIDVGNGVDNVALNVNDVIGMSGSSGTLDIILKGGSGQVLNLDNNLVDTGKDVFRDGYTFSLYQNSAGTASVYVAHDDGATINNVSGLV